jgi:Ca2+/H+ antiporter
MYQFLRSPMNWLFAFILVTLALEHTGTVPAPVIFFSAALAIIPIAALIVQATEQIASRTGDAIGGLLNATFGNAPELIISLTALKAGYVAMVRAALVGGILANLLLALGAAFLLGGFRHHDQRFNPAAARAYSTMMFLAAVSLAVPSAFSRYFSPEGIMRQEQMLNLGIAGLLLLAYGLYLVFSLKTHPGAFQSVGEADEATEIVHGPRGRFQPVAIDGVQSAEAVATFGGGEHLDRGDALGKDHGRGAYGVAEEAKDVSALAPDQVTDLAADQDEGGRHQRLEGDRRLDGADRGAQVLDDCRDRHVHQRGVDHEHEHRHRQQDPQPWHACLRRHLRVQGLLLLGHCLAIVADRITRP